jgi:hypothetical protein
MRDVYSLQKKTFNDTDQHHGDSHIDIPTFTEISAKQKNYCHKTLIFCMMDPGIFLYQQATEITGASLFRIKEIF